jgi:hypothetical protein
MQRWGVSTTTAIAVIGNGLETFKTHMTNGLIEKRIRSVLVFGLAPYLTGQIHHFTKGRSPMKETNRPAWAPTGVEIQQIPLDKLVNRKCPRGQAIVVGADYLRGTAWLDLQ